MNNNVTLLINPALVGIATIAALWVFVDTLNARELMPRTRSFVDGNVFKLKNIS
jgi:hypothetical protein